MYRYIKPEKALTKASRYTKNGAKNSFMVQVSHCRLQYRTTSSGYGRLELQHGGLGQPHTQAKVKRFIPAAVGPENMAACYLVPMWTPQLPRVGKVNMTLVGTSAILKS